MYTLILKNSYVNYLARFLLMSIGIMIVSSAIGVSQALNLGVAPIDTLVRTIVDIFPINFRDGVYLTNLMFLGICLLLTKYTKDSIASIIVTIIPVLLMGYVITYSYTLSVNVLHVDEYSFIVKCAVLIAAIMSLSIGLNCTIKANVMLTPYDKLILGIAHIFNTHYGQARILLDIILFATSLLLGVLFHNEVIFGIGTIAYMFGVGMCVEATRGLFKL